MKENLFHPDFSIKVYRLSLGMEGQPFLSSLAGEVYPYVLVLFGKISPLDVEKVAFVMQLWKTFSYVNWRGWVVFRRYSYFTCIREFVSGIRLFIVLEIKTLALE